MRSQRLYALFKMVENIPGVFRPLKLTKEKKKKAIVTVTKYRPVSKTGLVQLNLNSSNTAGSFIMANSDSFLNPTEFFR